MSNQNNSIQDALNLVIRHSQAGRQDKAEKISEQLLEVLPRNPDDLHSLGGVAYQLGRYELAIDLLNKAIQNDSTRDYFYCNLGSLLKSQGRLDEAVASYRNALSINPNSAEAHNNLGIALSDKGKLAEAAASYKRAIAINPTYAEAHNNLGIVLKAQGKMDEAATSSQRAITINPKFTEALYNLGVVRKDQGKLDEAVTLYERVLAADPTHPSARHMSAALGGETTESAPPEYVKVLFDQYSSNYDHHLVEKLHYNAPALLRKAFQSLFSHGLHFQNVMDLGCGTGLAGAEFRQMAARLSGIDISPKMIEEAGEKDIYDVLVVGDIMEFLSNTNEKYDVFIAADVFLYTGNLGPLFASIRTRSLIGTYLIFSTESSNEKSYVLRQTGRYVHSRSYIQTLAKHYGFIVEKCNSGGLRKEKGQWTMGDIFVLRHVN